jgi:hypothetical protein
VGLVTTVYYDQEPVLANSRPRCAGAAGRGSCCLACPTPVPCVPTLACGPPAWLPLQAGQGCAPPAISPRVESGVGLRPVPFSAVPVVPTLQSDFQPSPGSHLPCPLTGWVNRTHWALWRGPGDIPDTLTPSGTSPAECPAEGQVSLHDGPDTAIAHTLGCGRAGTDKDSLLAKAKVLC